MNDSGNVQKPSKKVLAVKRAGEIRRRRIAAAREREARIEQTVVGVITAGLVIEEANLSITVGVKELRVLGETPDSIADLCGMRVSDVRAALIAAKAVDEDLAVPVLRPG